MKKLNITIEEQPVAQKRHRHSRFHTYDPSSIDKERIRFLIKKQCSGFYTEGPVCMFITFKIQRPKSHFRTGKNKHKLKKSAPLFKTTKPDIDNHIKLYMDCLGDIWKDDCQVINISASKQWVNDSPCTQITIYKV